MNSTRAKIFRCQKCRNFFTYEENPEFPEEVPLLCHDCYQQLMLES